MNIKGQKYQTSKYVRVLAFIICLGLVAVIIAAFKPNAKDNATSSIRKVVIDAGHGGKDPGNLGTGRYKTTEKTIALNVSKKLGDYIEKAFPDVEVIYTRDDDSYPELHERTALANKHNADLFISIHCDAHHSSSPKGSSTFVMGLAKSEANLKMAQKENSVILKEENYQEKYGGFDPNSPEGLIELSLRQNVFLEQSLNFGKKVQDQFRTRVGRPDRGVRQAPFWVICFTTMPSVLIELGFLTNKEEEDFLQSEIGQDYMASAIYRAFKDYKMEMESMEVIAPGEIKPVQTPEVLATKAPEENKTGNPATEVLDKGITFKVQLASSKTAIPVKEENFNGIKDVEEFKIDGLFKYTTGSAKTYEKALEMQQDLRTKGFPGAFIVAFEGKERVSLQYAKEMAEKQKN